MIPPQAGFCVARIFPSFFEGISGNTELFGPKIDGKHGLAPNVSRALEVTILYG